MGNAFLMHPSWSSIHLMQWLGTVPSLRNRIFTWLITWGLWDCHCKEIPHFCSLALCSKENYYDFSVSLFFLSLSPFHLTEFKLILNNFNYSLNILTSCGVTFVFLSLECLPPRVCPWPPAARRPTRDAVVGLPAQVSFVSSPPFRCVDGGSLWGTV